MSLYLHKAFGGAGVSWPGEVSNALQMI